MSNIFNFVLKGADEEEEREPGSPNESEAPSREEISKDQMRQKRLGKLVDQHSAGATGNSLTEAMKVDSTDKEGSKSDPSASSSGGGVDGGSPRKETASVGSNAAPGVPGLKQMISLSPQSSPGKLQQQAGMNTPTKNARVLNNALESVFLFSLRPASATPLQESISGQRIKYMGTEGVGTGGQMLNGNNLTEALMERLADAEESVGSSVNYLVGSYKRILQKESTLHAEIRTEFFGCKAQCINFIVTALTDPDTFSPNSDSSLADFVLLLKDDTSPHMAFLLKDLAEELQNQGALSSVISDLVGAIYDGMNDANDRNNTNSGAQDMLAMMMGGGMSMPVRSIVSTSDFGSFNVIRSLSAADKRFAKGIAENDHFKLDAALVMAKPAARTNQLPNLFGFAMQQELPQQQGPQVVQGAALADTTILGRMLRNVTDARDPQFKQMFENAHIGMSRSVLEGNFARIRTSLNLAQMAVSDTLLSMLKAGEAKASALSWLEQAIVCNSENEKDQPDPRVGASRGFLLQLSGVLLRLCKPFLHDKSKLFKVDWRYLVHPDSEKVYSRQETGLYSRVVQPQYPASIEAPVGSTNAFMTTTLFLTARALHLSCAPMIRRIKNLSRHVNHLRDELRDSDPRAVHVFLEFMVHQTELLNPELLGMAIDYCGALAALLLDALRDGSSGTNVDGKGGGDSTIMGKDQLTATQLEVLSCLPEYLVMDMFEIINFTADARADLLDGTPFMNDVLELIIFFLRRPAAILSPHLRATLGLTLFGAFLPGSARDSWERQGNYKDGQQCKMLDSSIAARKYLAPALLLLYGDVERTGHYEKIDHRRKLGVVLKYLWSLPSHRAAFRDIANAADADENSSGNKDMSTAMVPTNGGVNTDDAESGPVSMEVEVESGSNAEEFDNNYFIRFANGIMNETNAQVNEALSNLAEIKNVQMLKVSAEWLTMTEDQRKQHEEKLDEAEQYARMAAGLCMDTIHMVKFLTSDEAIIVPFLKPEILPRFTSMLLNVVNKLTGKKSLELKVDNMEEYNFSPKDMLREICETILHVCTFDAFCEAVVKDGFFNAGVPLDNAIKIVSKHSLITPQQQQVLREFRERCSSAEAGAQALDEIVDHAPENYVDPLLLVLMTDPVLLKTSGNIVDRSTIVQQMLNDPLDPFNRAPITNADIEPQPNLKAEIEAWTKDKLAELAESKKPPAT